MGGGEGRGLEVRVSLAHSRHLKKFEIVGRRESQRVEGGKPSGS